MEINKLKTQELKELRDSISDRIEYLEREKEDEIRRKDSVKNKTKLSQLTSNDRIFAIHIFKNAYTYKMEIEIGYKNVNGSEFNFDSDGYSVVIGGSSMFIKNKESNKHYYLDNFLSNTRFIFYTLKPESWFKDLKEAKEYSINIKKEIFEKELELYKKGLNRFDEFKEEINKQINTELEKQYCSNSSSIEIELPPFEDIDEDGNYIGKDPKYKKYNK